MIVYSPLKHIYRSRFGFEKETCPICFSKTEQKFATIIYAADSSHRLSFSPSAWICEPCSCLVLDESLLVQTAKWKGYTYLLPLGVTHSSDFFVENEDESINLFQTYEGKKPVFVLDPKTKNVLDVIYKDEDVLSTCFYPRDGLVYIRNDDKSEEKKRQKRKAEKKARKKQRR